MGFFEVLPTLYAPIAMFVFLGVAWYFWAGRSPRRVMTRLKHDIIFAVAVVIFIAVVLLWRPHQAATIKCDGPVQELFWPCLR